jgi:hypothetical protein
MYHWSFSNWDTITSDSWDFRSFEFCINERHLWSNFMVLTPIVLKKDQFVWLCLTSQKIHRAPRMRVLGHLFSGRCSILHRGIGGLEAAGIWRLELSLVSLNHCNLQACFMAVSPASRGRYRRWKKTRTIKISSSEDISTLIQYSLLDE